MANASITIVTTLVDGTDLDRMLGRVEMLPAPRAARLIGEVLSALAAAHELGIVHRDIKGGNVMVIERSGELLPKLLDFGIAKGDGELPSPGVDSDGLTGHGSTLGSLPGTQAE